MLSRKLALLLHTGRIHAEGLVAYLKEHNLTSLFPAIIKNLHILEHQEIEKNTLVIESPFPLSEESVKTIETKITGSSKGVRIRQEINQPLLAGFVARLRGKEYDSSAASILRTFIKES